MMKANTASVLLVMMISGIVAYGCGQDGGNGSDLNSRDVPQFDEGSSDTGIDSSTRDESAGDDGQHDADAAADTTWETTDEGGPNDASVVDAADAVEDTVPELVEERMGWAWNSSPADLEPVSVPFRHLQNARGKLTGSWADVWNCLNEEGGPTQMIAWGNGYYQVSLCHYAQTVTPGNDGSYLHVLPPEDERDGNDPFAESMTYYSINRVHDFFGDRFGHTDADRSLFSVVNIQFRIEDGDYWMPLDNAAYMPDASYGFVGFNMHDGEMLAFGQGENIDFCSDASVVFHEYTHYLIGSNRLLANRADKWGFSDDPIALNEGFADYFASTILGNPVLGEYSLGEQARDLTKTNVCPDHYVGESHQDGKIWSTTLWEIRTTLGPEKADEIAYRTLVACSQVTNFAEAAAILQEVVAEVSPDDSETVTGILNRHNVLDCARLLEFGTETAGKGYYLPGTMDSYIQEFQSSVAGTFQYKVTVPEGIDAFDVYFMVEDATGYGENPEVKLLVKPGEDPITWSYRYGATNNADKSFVSERVNSHDVKFRVSGECVRGGTYYFQLINKGSGTVVARLNNVDFLDSWTGDATWTGCSFADDLSTGDVSESDI